MVPAKNTDAVAALTLIKFITADPFDLSLACVIAIVEALALISAVPK